MDHSELIQEMPHIEQLPTQERLNLARKRRAQQLKHWINKEKEFNRKPSKLQKSSKPNIKFKDSVVLLEAAARNDIEEVKHLLSKGVSPDSCNEDGLTALHQCCIDDNEAMLQLLLEYGANVNSEDSEKWTPLHAAATCGHLRLVRILIARGANLLAVNADGNMPYDICEDEQTLDYIESEMAKRGVTQQLIDDTRALTEKNMLNDLKRIVANGGDLEFHDHQGATPLHIASANGYTSVVEYLLEQNVRTDVVDRDDWQPVHAAACWGHLDVLELLAQAGADLNAKNKNDETPEDICEDPELKERIRQLKTEQENKRLLENQKKRVRRSQSNTRVHSVRRTSLRDRGMTARRDAVEEARLRMEAEHNRNLEQEAAKNGQSPPSSTDGTNTNPSEGDGTEELSNNTTALAPSDRRAPEGKDNDSLLASETYGDGDKNESAYTTDVNDLKKQRMEIRKKNDVNSLTASDTNSVIPEVNLVPTPSTADLTKFTGGTDEIVEHNRRCCAIQ
ncbi:protein phosphatase 1 regulatory inhibitor subunit 16B isoform X2 [Agrilus planipennis]|uniref:Protein phosphatase 1 regulatory subunit 16A n=1 Tax=Agrilus planipennis TaxID=224129 RepID=A0A1W4W935_AGRPL|nr:protein phosphatase 1 regulatory inhibitor subunit 16B isoform X2 [Agrilus planipennis]